jgi:putative DNA primase/helicase
VSGDLLAGWIVLAPFSGALRWRPHIWVTGTAGAGETTVVNDIIKPLVAVAVGAEGPTTEAGLRGELKGAALPVLFDEVERSGTSSAARSASGFL